MRGWIRRGSLVAVVAVALGLLAWFASAMLSASRFEATAEDRGAMRVTTRLPLATCSKTLTSDFPWVRLTCEDEDE